MTIAGKWWNPRIFAGGYEFSPVLNNAVLQHGAELKDASCFGHATRINAAGLRAIALQCSGFADLSDDETQDYQSYTNIGLDNIPVSVMPTNTPAEGDLCYFFQAAGGQYQIGGAIGEILPISFNLVNGASGHPLIHGRVLDNGQVAKSAAGNGNGFLVSAVAADEFLYGILHVTEVSTGDDITVLIESDSAGDFLSPTTRISFTLASAIGGQYAARVAGPITDTYWRASWTVNGTGVSIKIASAMGIAGK